MKKIKNKVKYYKNKYLTYLFEDLLDFIGIIFVAIIVLGNITILSLAIYYFLIYKGIK